MSIQVKKGRVTAQQFAEHLHTVFTLRTGGAALAGELVDVAVRTEHPQLEQFTLTFRVPAGTAPVQCLWDVEHPALDTQPMLLVPVRRDSDGLYLEAAFNRLVNAEGREA